MKRNDLTIPATLVLILSVPATSAGQSADELPPELLACAAETDVARRLECFDREMAKLQATPEPVSPPVIAAEPAPEPAEEPAPAPVVAETPPEPAAAEPPPPVTAATPQREIPSPAPRAVAPPATAAAAAAATIETAPSPAAAPRPAPAPEQASGQDFGLPSAGPNEIVAKVTNIMKRPYGEMVILLDNGQIWEQKHRDNRFRLDVGDDVTISEGLISGYRLTGGGRNNSIQVERLK